MMGWNIILKSARNCSSYVVNIRVGARDERHINCFCGTVGCTLSGVYKPPNKPHFTSSIRWSNLKCARMAVPFTKWKVLSAIKGRSCLPWHRKFNDEPMRQRHVRGTVKLIFPPQSGLKPPQYRLATVDEQPIWIHWHYIYAVCAHLVWDS